LRGYLALALAAGVGCGSSTAGPDVVFDACAPLAVAAPAADADQIASIGGAVAMWNARGVTGLARADAGAVTIEFRDAADAFYGFYDAPNATVYINLRLTDPAERAITIAHEIGHAYALVHISLDERASVMNPGNLTVAPNDGDTTALAALWGACR